MKNKKLPTPLDEEALEAAFWAFKEDSERSGMERDAFKRQMRGFARQAINQAIAMAESEGEG
jgi:hypothetical protein